SLHIPATTRGPHGPLIVERFAQLCDAIFKRFYTTGNTPATRSETDQAVLTRRYRLPCSAPLAMLAAFNGSGVMKCGV
ncbi:hypothetical protein, partial [Paraburkholderia domus]|uniref:hypothetical protein n=1 Tax=Paraburkholderia domus TaxID=2793075 RepID=UPI001BA4CAE9